APQKGSILLLMYSHFRTQLSLLADKNAHSTKAVKSLARQAGQFLGPMPVREENLCSLVRARQQSPRTRRVSPAQALADVTAPAHAREPTRAHSGTKSLAPVRDALDPLPRPAPPGGDRASFADKQGRWPARGPGADSAVPLISRAARNLGTGQRVYPPADCT